MNFLLFAQLFAQDPAPGAGQQPGGFMNSPMAPMFILGAIMLFMVMVVFPAQRRTSKQHAQALSTLKRGTKILTTGGIVATIVSAKDGEDEIVIRSEDTKLRIKRNVVAQVIGTDEAEAAKG